MRMYTQQAIERLVSLMYEHKDEDAGTVLELWRQELEVYEAQSLAQQQALLAANPPRYGLSYGESFVYTDAGGGDVREYRPVRVVYFTEEKIPDVARNTGLSVKVINQLIKGEIFEHDGWRGLNERSLSNGAYIPRNTEKLEMRAQIQREDAEIEKYAAKLKPYVAAQPPKVEVYE